MIDAMPEADVFVSYSRSDSDFVQRLTASLEEHAKSVWLDTEGIADGEVFPEALRQAIEGSDAFVFVITPASVASPYCTQEIEHAHSMGKRILPLLRSAVPDSQLHPEVRDRNWIPFDDETVFERSLERLLSALDHDLEHAQAHTRWLVKALDWENHRRDKSLLLRGSELTAAEAWLAQVADGAEPAPTQLQREYIYAGRRASARRQRLVVGSSLAAVAISLALAAVAFIQRSDAQRNARVALARELGSEAVSEPRIDEAMLLARESVDLDRSQATAGTLLATVLRTPAAIATFTVPIGLRPQSVALSPNGHTLAVTTVDSVRLYDTATRRPLRAFGNSGYGEPVTYAPDGSAFLAVGGTAEPEIDLIDARTLKRLRILHFDRRWLSVRTDCCAPFLITTDGQTVLYAYGVLNPDGSEGPAFVDRWNLRTGKLVSTTPVGAPGAFSVNLIDHGRRLAIGGPRAVTILDARTLRRVETVRLSSASPIVNAVIDPSGRTVAFGTETGSVSFVDVASGRVTRASAPHTATVTAMGFAPDGRVLVSAASDASVIAWNPATAQPIQRLVGHGGSVTGLSFSADSKTLYTASLDGAIFKWDLGNDRRFGRPFATVDPPAPPPLGEDAQRAPPLAISPDGRRFAVRVGRSTVAIFSTRTLHQLDKFPVQTGGEVIGMTWSHSGEIAVTGDEGHVQLWDVTETPRLVRSLHGLRSTNKQPEAVTTVAFSPDGRRVAAGDVNHTAGANPIRFGTVAVWDTGSGKLLWKARTTHGSVTAVPFAPDGQTIAAAREDGTVAIYDAATGRLQREVRVANGEKSSVEGIAASFAPDGTLATGNAAGIVQLWNAKNGSQIGHPTLVAAAPVSSIDFNRTSDTFATTSTSDGVLKLWTTATQRQFGATFPGSPGNAGNAAFTPNGSELVVIYQDGTGSEWPATVEAWEKHACEVAGRNFTHEEWSRFVSGRPFSRVCGN